MSIIFYYSIFTASTSFFVGLCCLYKIRKNQILTPIKSFLWHYSIGFLIWGLNQVFFLFINSGLEISYAALTILIIFGFLTTVAAYYFFLKATISLFIKNKFVVTVFPFIYGLTMVGFFTFLLTVVKVESIFAITVAFWGFILPVNLLLGFCYLYFFINGIPFDSLKGNPSVFVLSFAWFYTFILNTMFWFSFVEYHQELYILKIAASKEWLIYRAIGHLLILAGFILYCDCLYRLKTPEHLRFREKTEKSTAEPYKNNE